MSNAPEEWHRKLSRWRSHHIWSDASADRIYQGPIGHGAVRGMLGANQVRALEADESSTDEVAGISGREGVSLGNVNRGERV
jgi:hypothetical protein